MPLHRTLACACLLALVSPVFAAPAFADPTPAVMPEGYSIETIVLPSNAPAHVTGVDASTDGSVWICTREGDVWKHTGGAKDGKWTRFAEGLQEPCGLLLDRVDGKETGKVCVTQKPELTLLADTDGDGQADEYTRVAATGRTSGNYHEFNHGLVRDAKGNFYGALNLGNGYGNPNTAPGYKLGSGIMCGEIPGSGCYRGTFYRVTPAGKFEVIAWGLRSPCGVGLTTSGKLIYSENQGDWMPSSFLAVVQQDQFYGHPSGIVDHPLWKDKKIGAEPVATWNKWRTMPAVWIPYRELASSPGQPVEDATGGKFGPFAGQIFMGDQTQSNLMRFTLQEVKGQWQGFCIDFINHARCGIVRCAFDAEGRLYMGEVNTGWWNSSGDLPSAVERVAWDGKTVPFCIKDIKLEKEGFRVSFTKPVDPATVAAAKIGIKRWTYNFWANYGSPNVDEKKGPAIEAQVAPDNLSILVKAELVRQRVYDLKLPEVRSADGKALSVNHGYYTLNETVE